MRKNNKSNDGMLRPEVQDKRTGLSWISVGGTTVRTVVLDCGLHCARCPVTGHADILKIKISYECTGKAIETGSLWRYLMNLDDLRISHEQLHNLILEDLTRAFSKGIQGIKVAVEYVPRGGIAVSVAGRV